jgi:hypothetical protein
MELGRLRGTHRSVKLIWRWAPFITIVRRCYSLLMGRDALKRGWADLLEAVVRTKREIAGEGPL